MVVALLAYALLRVAAGYSSLLSNRPYHELTTLAGNIRPSNFVVDSEIYRFVIENSRPTDVILDIPNGGGMNVATHRLSRFFSRCSRISACLTICSKRIWKEFANARLEL